MGVYIKGCEKPRSCGECFIGRRFMCEHVETFEDCPMVEVPEPHGRLIDADALVNTVVFHTSIPADIKEFIEDLIGIAPTVIEAEEDDPQTERSSE